MKMLVATIALLGPLVFAGSAQGHRASGRLLLVGPHVHADIRGKHVGLRLWADLAAVNVPLPDVRVGVYYGDPATYPGNQVYIPKVGLGGWTALAVHGLFVHELGHVFDRTYMTPALRHKFMADIGVTCKWWTKCKTTRWVSGPGVYVNIPPGEMFAEEYAACALGLTQRGYQDAGYNTYGWVPPEGTDEAALCGLMRSAAVGNEQRTPTPRPW